MDGDKISGNRKFQFVQKYFICFVMYAVLGWTYEVILEVFIYRWGFSNRGVLFGPYCPVYGVGAMAFLLCFNKVIVKKKQDESLKKFLLKPKFYISIIAVFLGCMFIATAIELAASYILEAITGEWLWMTYARDYDIHFQGRIALSPSLRFGLGGVLFLYLLQPLFNRILRDIKPNTYHIVSGILAVLLTADCIYTFILK